MMITAAAADADAATNVATITTSTTTNNITIPVRQPSLSTELINDFSPTAIADFMVLLSRSCKAVFTNNGVQGNLYKIGL